MKSFKISGPIFLSIFLLSSCAFYSGNMNGSAALNHGNFKLVKSVTGSAIAHYFLGIGGLGKDGLLAAAKDDLYSKNTIKKGQVLANLSVDYKHSFYFIYWETKAIITADLIDFNDLEEEQKEERQSSPSLSNTDFQLKETVTLSYMGKYYRGTIQALNSKKATITYTLSDGLVVSTEKSLHKIFKTQNTGSFGVKEKCAIGDSILIQKLDTKEYGVITALGVQSFLSEIKKSNGNSKTLEIPYNSTVYSLLKKN